MDVVQLEVLLTRGTRLIPCARIHSALESTPERTVALLGKDGRPLLLVEVSFLYEVVTTAVLVVTLV